MADSDSTNATAQAAADVAGDLETTHNTLRILNDLTNEQAFNWSSTDNKETVGEMVERIIVLTNTMSQKLDDLSKLVNKAYKIGFNTKDMEATHV